ncbi:FMN-dependent oxidoreductase (nitrilotriacetate monooxygenase family) [Inquilinus ginsengisoli]|uniref:FMN-dependent oxidoreductase (Nitrilotriacetate monooxygenase family) n=1 Tax=Inquilinus ginsengisoli TaxID=363840 RepID=A0ABU1JRG5_9PROT|nr:LLM class flavin-dependent oxidoreductase [Inquilinus ginsengisoli]MDR6290175.1 FMN-dependent oxidoreductase (nitrilotriacetate monooxygenase family) [Inquilinus ginsengisoli]
MRRRHMILSAFFFNPQGDHRMSWRHPRAPGREVFGLDYYRKLAEAAERAKLDTLFIADHVAIWDSVESGVAHYANARLEPLTLLSALSAVTSHIGLIATASSSYSEPYNLARTFASLDHLSGGRAAWNVVTSAMDEEALNFGRDGNIEHAHRYDRAAEYLDAVTALWDSWEDEAVLLDRESGYFADPGKVHRIDHAGPHFKVRGPLNVPRPPQGHPLIVQAGSSEAGKDLAAAYADVHFAIIRSIDEGLRYRADINARLAKHGRAPESFKILPGILPIVAGSADEAKERQEFLETLLPERVGIDLLSSWAGIDLSAYPPDGPLPELPDESTFNGGRTSLNRVRGLANQNLSIRQIARKLANSGSMPTVAGTAKEVADQLEAWFVAGAVDGYNLMFPLLPEDWVNFTETVVPELQRRGVFRQEYEPGTLRDRLGLSRPPNRFAVARDTHRAAS